MWTRKAQLLEDTIQKGVDGGVAAIMLEPILGNGGHIVLPRSFLGGVRDLCTCFDRTGAMFAADLYGIVLDIMSFGKGIGGGCTR